MTTSKRYIKPTVETKFHIDYEWWNNQERELNVYLMSLLPEQKREYLELQATQEAIDYIDPVTAEVHKINMFEKAIRETADEIDLTKTSLVDAVFRIFLLNHNQPLSPRELSNLTGRPAETILRTIGNPNQTYRGIRPYQED